MAKLTHPCVLKVNGRVIVKDVSFNKAMAALLELIPGATRYDGKPVTTGAARQRVNFYKTGIVTIFLTNGNVARFIASTSDELKRIAKALINREALNDIAVYNLEHKFEHWDAFYHYDWIDDIKRAPKWYPNQDDLVAWGEWVKHATFVQYEHWRPNYAGQPLLW